LIVNPEIMSRVSAMKDINETRVVTLSGSVMHKYTVEVAAGTTIRSIIEDYGGGVSNGKAIKAVQPGGASGAFISSDDLDAAIDSESIEVFEADSSIVDATKGIMAYIQSQSCGKCVFCREGCLQILTILEDITENRGKPQDLDLLLELGEEMRDICLCAFGRSAPDSVLSSIQLFRSEYEKRV
jgi:NADH:ubiquinone oxidoreductase subunit F (NADH-binding)